jgi:hypothetical protein
MEPVHCAPCCGIILLYILFFIILQAFFILLAFQILREDKRGFKTAALISFVSFLTGSIFTLLLRIAVRGVGNILPIESSNDWEHRPIDFPPLDCADLFFTWLLFSAIYLLTLCIFTRLLYKVELNSALKVTAVVGVINIIAFGGLLFLLPAIGAVRSIM